MTHKRTELGYFIHLEPGEELVASLIQFAKQYDVLGGEVYGIGLTEKVTLGFYTKEINNYSWQKFAEAFEILNITGNISTLEGEPIVHIHGVFGRADFSTVGGHVGSLEIGKSGEVIVIPHDVTIERKKDFSSGMYPWFFRDTNNF